MNAALELAANLAYPEDPGVRVLYVGGYNAQVVEAAGFDPVQDGTVPAYRAAPEKGGPLPTVLVVQESLRTPRPSARPGRTRYVNRPLRWPEDIQKRSYS